jgi:hypothetical protein
MGKKKIVRFIFSLVLLLGTQPLLSQETEWKGISLGVDLSRIAIPFIDTTRYGWQFSGDYEILKDLFLLAELGSETTTLNKADYFYKSSGVYTRLGVDYNYINHIDNGNKDMMFIGVRYGFTTFYHQASDIIIKNNVWGDFPSEDIDTRWLAGNWFEIATGMRTRLFNNFYLGWSAKVKMKIGVTNDNVLSPYNVPGYGNTWNNTSVGFSYSLIYKIPIYKKKVKSTDTN